MNKYQMGETKLIFCSGCSEIVSVPAEYKGDLCPSCEETSPYSMYETQYGKQTKGYSKPIGDHSLLFRKMILSVSPKVKL
jgi:hypothetical protein